MEVGLKSAAITRVWVFADALHRLPFILQQTVFVSLRVFTTHLKFVLGCWEGFFGIGGGGDAFKVDVQKPHVVWTSLEVCISPSFSCPGAGEVCPVKLCANPSSSAKWLFDPHLAFYY